MATLYIRQGATGSNNGTDWDNAYSSMPTLVRGNTYYIADGSYGSYSFNQSGTSLITIKKATGADHGTGTGWVSSYGDGVASFSGWTFTQGYYYIDGQVGGGPDSWTSGFGIEVNANKGRRVYFSSSSVDYITIRHTEIYNDDNTANDSQYGHLVEAVAGGVTNITFSYCYIHHVFGCCFKTRSGSDNWTVEYSKVGDNTGTSANHSEIWSIMGSDNIIIRYSYLFQWRSTGGIIAINGSEGSYGDNEICEDWEIYGNIFEQGGTTASYIMTAINDASNQQFARRWKCYNNTIINANSTANTVYVFRLDTYGENGNEFKNNIIYGNTDTMQVSGEESEDYNSYQGSSMFFTGANDAYLSSSPFTNYAGQDYTLSGPLAGVSLDAAYSYDMYGNLRGADGVWDRGAFEYVTGGAPSDTWRKPYIYYNRLRTLRRK